MDNISVGYTLPKTWTSKFGVPSAKIFATVKNPFVWSPNGDWTKYDWDPETAGYNTNGSLSAAPGESAGTPQPNVRIYSLGINVSL